MCRYEKPAQFGQAFLYWETIEKSCLQLSTVEQGLGSFPIKVYQIFNRINVSQGRVGFEPLTFPYLFFCIHWYFEVSFQFEKVRKGH